MSIIEVRGLRKEYRRARGEPVIAVDDLDLSVPEGGGVYGFLGPNGSGKTTTIRCMLGLIRPTDGRVRLLDTDVADLHHIIHRVGALVETPKFFPSFSGRRNLSLLATVAGIDDSEIDRVLELVNLRDRDHDSFDSYSLGMKQRLAVAATLLKRPDLLILDEPANGLDPAGIVEIRQLIRSLGEGGQTIFVSSHQLGEVQQTCDSVAIINHGSLVASGTVDELVARAGGKGLIVTIDERERAIEVLQLAGVDADPLADASEFYVEIEPTDGARITQLLAEQGLFLRAMREQSATLESAFLELTEGVSQ